MEPTTALAVRAPQALDPYSPTNIAEAQSLAKMYAASKMLGAYGTPEQVMMVMATGHDLGLSPSAALRGLYLVEGRIYMSADLMVAVCLRSSVCERFDLTEQTDTSAAYTVQRAKGQPLTFRFSLEDAARAQLGAKDGSNWKKYPGTMCRHRAAAQAARAVFPDVIMGLAESEEREDVEPARDVTPSQVQPLTPAATTVADAQIVTPETDDAAERRLKLALIQASSVDAAAPTVKEIQARWKDGPARDRLRAVLKARKDAAWAVATVEEPAHDADGVVLDSTVEG